MTTYKINAEIEIQFQPPGMGLPDDEYEVAYPRIEIEYRYSPGAPAVMYQSNGDPGWPAEPAEIEVIAAKLIVNDGLLPTPSQIHDWATDYLNSESGYRHAVDHADDMRRPDPDEAYERRRDAACGRPYGR